MSNCQTVDMNLPCVKPLYYTWGANCFFTKSDRFFMTIINILSQGDRCPIAQNISGLYFSSS